MLARETQPSCLAVSQSENWPHTLLCAFLVPTCSVAQSCLTLCDPMDCSLPEGKLGVALESLQGLRDLILPGESQGRGRLVGCRLWGSTELDTTEAT